MIRSGKRRTKDGVSGRNVPALRRPIATRHRPRGQGAPADQQLLPLSFLGHVSSFGPGRTQDWSPGSKNHRGSSAPAGRAVLVPGDLRAQLSWQLWASRGRGRGARSQGSSSPRPGPGESRMEAKDESGCRAQPGLCGAQVQGTQLRTPELTGPRRTVTHPSLENDLQRE